MSEIKDQIFSKNYIKKLKNNIVTFFNIGKETEEKPKEDSKTVSKMIDEPIMGEGLNSNFFKPIYLILDKIFKTSETGINMVTFYLLITMTNKININFDKIDGYQNIQSGGSEDTVNINNEQKIDEQKIDESKIEEFIDDQTKKIDEFNNLNINSKNNKKKIDAKQICKFIGLSIFIMIFGTFIISVFGLVATCLFSVGGAVLCLPFVIPCVIALTVLGFIMLLSK